MAMNEDKVIDAVITWVDGADPVHKAKRMTYSDAGAMENEDIAAETRFRSVGEIHYCVASLLRFAPFLRKIFIVTDGQDPGLEAFVDRNFPERTTEIIVVDHKDIYSGYGQYLPVFNSLSIETALWRIPGLSEQYIYLNDDFLLTAPVTEETFFREGRAVCYASMFSVTSARILRSLKHVVRPYAFGFKDAMLNAADAVNERTAFPYIGHVPLPILRSVLEDFFTKHEELFIRNISPRFRELHQFNPQVLFYLLAIRSGRCTVLPRKGMDLYLKPKDRSGYVAAKLETFDSRENAPFCCFNSLDCASPEDMELVRTWIMKRLSLNS